MHLGGRINGENEKIRECIIPDQIISPNETVGAVVIKTQHYTHVFKK